MININWTEIREDDGDKAHQQNYDMHIITKKKKKCIQNTISQKKEFEVVWMTWTIKRHSVSQTRIKKTKKQKTLLRSRASPSSQALLQTGLPVQETDWVFCVRSEGREPESEHSSFSPSVRRSTGTTGCRVG